MSTGGPSGFFLRCLSFRECRRGTLVAFADFLILPIGLRIDDCPVHVTAGSKWVGLPARPRLDARSNLVRAANGRPEYSRLLSFPDKADFNRWSAPAVLAALKHSSDAFGDSSTDDSSNDLSQEKLL